MSETSTEARPFGFTVRRAYNTDPPTWWVALPHQCDSWEIAGDQHGSFGGLSQEDAVDALERFIAEAQHALDELRAGRELAGDDLVDDWDESHPFT